MVPWKAGDRREGDSDGRKNDDEGSAPNEGTSPRRRGSASSIPIVEDSAEFPAMGRFW
ncbi:MAG: hypothetical protein NVS3B20_22130 [Polyangiales bacterium]